jgi:hypothetical protein
MTPTLPTFLAVATFGALCWLVGFTVGRRFAWFQLIETLRIMGRQDQANPPPLTDPFRGQWRADPSALAAFLEGRENPRMN